MFGLKEDLTGDLFRYIGNWGGAKIDQIELMSDDCIIPKNFSDSIITPKNNDGDVYMGVNNGTPLGTIVDNKQRRYPAFIKNEYGKQYPRHQPILILPIFVIRQPIS